MEHAREEPSSAQNILLSESCKIEGAMEKTVLFIKYLFNQSTPRPKEQEFHTRVSCWLDFWWLVKQHSCVAVLTEPGSGLFFGPTGDGEGRRRSLAQPRLLRLCPVGSQNLRTETPAPLGREPLLVLNNLCSKNIALVPASTSPASACDHCFPLSCPAPEDRAWHCLSSNLLLGTRQWLLNPSETFSSPG